MEKTLLWEAFASLTSAEAREFGKFVRSPFFNARQQPVVLFDYLDGCRRAGRLPKDAEAAAILNKTEGGVKARQTNSALLALLEKYLAYAEKFQDEGRAKIRLAALPAIALQGEGGPMYNHTYFPSNTKRSPYAKFYLPKHWLPLPNQHHWPFVFHIRVCHLAERHPDSVPETRLRTGHFTGLVRHLCFLHQLLFPSHSFLQNSATHGF